MFKLAVLAAILAVATAAPGGLTGIVPDHAIGPIQAPLVLGAAAVAAPVAHVISQPVAPIVRTPAIVTKSVLTAAPLPLLSAHGSLH
ncbi:flagellar hook-length control protein-like [Hylaeus anthracinus]|uniref:flagellar hook-length control protein-like n=1 Tax=Hylaeus anthracinus TaxID=313031 RepID=UPI0023B98AB2|nr:flagellar hook-length control protein-like [Hylaeus anthracinus]